MFDIPHETTRMRDMPGPVTDPRAGALLRRYLDTYGGEEIPVPVESIAEDLLGLRVSEADLTCSGLLVPAERRIWVNAAEASQAPGRRRFTIAHELGHWVCQVLEGRWQPVFCREVEAGGNGYPPLEREANVFAAELLMPEGTVRVRVGSGSPADLAERFGVSSVAMHWRLYNLGLVEASPT
jgi:hypothetical protein